MATTYELKPTVGLAEGMTVQFAEGQWPGEIGDGVAMTDEAFNIVEPHLRAAASNWTPMHRYGVFELKPAVRRALVSEFRNQALRVRQQRGPQPQAEVLEALASWLEARLGEAQTISILGY